MHLQKRSPDPFFYEGGEIGVLLIHGFSGTPSELRPMGAALHKWGYTVSAPLLSGHGSTVKDMGNSTWSDWLNSVCEAYEKLAKEVDQVILAGFSMGGLLAFEVAHRYPIQGIVSMCTPIWIVDWQAITRTLLNLFKPTQLGKVKKEAHIEEHLVPIERTSLRSIGNLNRLIRKAKMELPKITSPVLIIQAEKDETIIPNSANYIYQQINSKLKGLTFYPNSSHIITLDRERNHLFDETHQFIKTITNC